MAKKIHYEVFLSRAGSRAWVFHQTLDDRGQALNAAKYALLQKDFSGAKVVKEIHDPESDEYLPITIFEEGGPTTTKVARRRRQGGRIPCVKPRDLYSPDARVAISQVLEDTLTSKGLTTMELLHRADVLESLQAGGTVLQHAMQKWAVTYAAKENLEVTEIMKQLNELVSRGMERVFKEDRAGEVPSITGGDLGPVWDVAYKALEPDYVINRSIAHTLSKVDDLSGKLPVLMALVDHLPDDEHGQKVCLASIDEFVADMVIGRASLDVLVGVQPDLGASLTLMIDLFLGRTDNEGIVKRKGLKQLARSFDRGHLPRSRRGVIGRVLQELNGIKCLSPDDVHREVTLTRQLAKKLVLCQGQMVSNSEVVSAFENRSARLTTPEMTERYMSGALTPDARIEILLDLADNIIGDANKARLVHYITPILTGPKMEQIFLDGDEPLLRRLGRLAALQSRVFVSVFPDAEKKKIIEDFDKLSSRVEEEGKLFLSIMMRPVTGAEKALTFLRLLDAKILTEGACAIAASRHILELMRDPSFTGELAEVKFPSKLQASRDPVVQFRGLVEKTGVQERVESAKAG